MRYIIDKENRPVYLQLYKQIRDDIIAQNYKYNTKLPSKRSLAEETGVSTVTVEHAYALLCDEGYVESRERSGFVVIFRKTDGFATSSEHHTEHPGHHVEHNYPDCIISEGLEANSISLLLRVSSSLCVRVVAPVPMLLQYTI